MANEEFDPGERWRFRCRPHEEDGLVTIHRCEDGTAHVALSEVRIFNGTSIGTTVDHLPITSRALRECVTARAGEGHETPKSFETGYAQWETARGGVFDVPLTRLLGMLELGMAKPEPLLDHAITTMRELRNDDAIEYAIRALLAQPTLSFISQPGDSSRPLLWQFDGRPPCIPVFSSTERASAFIAEAGMEPAEFMTAPCDEAVEWILTGLDEDVGYANVNVGTDLSLPIYFELLEKVRDKSATEG